MPCGELQDNTVTNMTHARNLAVLAPKVALGKMGCRHAPGLTPPKLSLGTYISLFTTPRVLLCRGRTRDRGRPHTLVLLRRGGERARANTEGLLPPAQDVPARKANLVEGIVVDGT
jgi:hypothetical protein